MAENSFAVSTHLFHGQRLTRDHLVELAAHGFDSIELFATRSHFDYRDAHAIDELSDWLADTRLTLHSVHAPAFEAFREGQWVAGYCNASSNESRRKEAIGEAEAAMAIASRIPFRYLVSHLGIPAGQSMEPGDNHPDAARKSVEELATLAGSAGVRLALEVMPNPLSSAAALASLVEEDLDGLDVGICLDYGHAHLMGDLGEAIETLSGHLWTTHVHDNRGKRDEHLPPYAGSIDWDAAMMETLKIGYDGALVFEVGGGDDPLETLKRIVRARERLEKSFVVF